MLTISLEEYASEERTKKDMFYIHVAVYKWQLITSCIFSLIYVYSSIYVYSLIVISIIRINKSNKLKQTILISSLRT